MMSGKEIRVGDECWSICDRNVSNNVFVFGPKVQMILNSSLQRPLVINIPSKDGTFQASEYIPIEVLIEMLDEAGYKVTKKED